MSGSIPPSSLSGLSAEPLIEPKSEADTHGIEPEPGKWRSRGVHKKAGRKIQGLRKKSKYRRPKSSASRLSSARRVAAKSILGTARISTQAVREKRVFSSRELLNALGNPLRKSKALTLLCKRLDQFNREVASSESTLSSSDKALKALKLREEIQAYCDKKASRRAKKSNITSKANRKLRVTHAVANQADLLLTSFTKEDKAASSKAICQILCDDIKTNDGQRLKKLYAEPALLKKVLGHMAFAELFHLMQVQGSSRQNEAPVVSITEPKQIRALASICYQAVNQLSSEELRQEQQRYYNEHTSYGEGTEFPRIVTVSGDLAYDRSAISTELLNNATDSYDDLSAVGIIIHQAYKDGQLSMDKLDELTEQKTRLIMGNEHFDQMAETLDPKLVGSLNCYKNYLNPPKGANESDAEHERNLDHKKTLWLGKALQFQAMLAGDTEGKDKKYRDFIHTWDRLRFEHKPEYNDRHKKDNLVDWVPDTSRELAKITPDFLAELQQNREEPSAIKQQLEKAGWRKAPDEADFKALIKKAESTSKERVAQRTKQAVHDCLFRFFEKETETTIPVIPPRPKTGSR